MSFQFSYNELDDTFSEENVNEFSIRDSIIFVVDGTLPMYKNDSFLQCVETYKNIVRQKCADNRKDKMGLIIFGTKESNCGLDNIMVLQAFDKVTVDALNNIQNILKEGNEKYKSLASDSKYPLYDALTHAFQMINLSKSNQKTHNIILLCTCNDNPCSDVPVERRRIEHLVATFKDNQTELRVVGLSDSWNDEIYYKDLQIISGTFSNEDYKPTCLKDFEQIILSPARSICRIPWKISSNISIEVSVFNLISSPKYPFKIKLQKEDNEILEARRFLCEEKVEDSESQNLTEIKRDRKVITDSNIIYYKVFAGQNISFKPFEYKKLRNLGLEPCIEVLAFKPIMCDPLYHCTSPYFITYTAFCNEESKAFFMSFVSKCAQKKVMPICKVITRSTVLISMMIPSEDDGGFYMYKMPYNGNVRDLNYILERCVYNSEDKCPINKEAVDIFKRLMDLSKIEFDPKLFKNPKLERYIAHIEALALDEKLSSLPPDSTLPPPVHRDVEELREKLSRLSDLESATKKRSMSQSTQHSKRTKLDVKTLAERKQLHTLNVADLKECLKSLNLPISGSKSKLIDRVNEYFNFS